MNKRILIGLLGLLLVLKAEAQKVSITGKVPSGIEQVRLMRFDGESLGYQQNQLTQVSDLTFQLEWDFDQPNLYKLVVGDQEVRLAISEPAEIEVKVEANAVAITGSEESLALKAFEQKNGALQAKHFGALKIEADEAMAKGDKEALAQIQKKSAKAIQEFLVDFRKAIIDMGEGPGGYFALQFSDFNKEIDFIKTRLQAFQERIPDSPVTRALEKQVYRATVVAIGAVPPPIAARDIEGKDFSLDQFKGKLLLIDFWAAWCRACRIENPQFVALYNTYNAQGLEMVSISQDKDKKTWQEAIEKDGVGIWRQVQDLDGQISALYSISSLPQNVVLGREGKIIAKNVTAEALKKLLENHL